MTKEEINKIIRCLSFFKSVILSGENWTTTCDTELKLAFKTLDTEIERLSKIEEREIYLRSSKENNDINSQVESPSHYNSHPSGIECIKIVEHHNFNIGSAIKYLWRCGLKESESVEKELRKSIQYIKFELKRLGYQVGIKKPNNVTVFDNRSKKLSPQEIVESITSLKDFEIEGIANELNKYINSKRGKNDL